MKRLGRWLCRHGLHCWDSWVGFHPDGRWGVVRTCIRKGCGKTEWI
ncbi:hypothetical protein SEA_GUSANITA_67 [Arthrobacter phage Gusanita]|nr:hypothetical protein SEA_GUSANITA_67 [Arthrobacter phage Gusanita]